MSLPNHLSKQIETVHGTPSPEKWRAKREWQRELSKECSATNFAISPKKAWTIAREIAQGYSCHFKKVIPQQLKNARSEAATTNKENADATQAYFKSVFDRSNIQVDETVLDDIAPLDIEYDTLQNSKPPPPAKKLKMPSIK
jgi:hypothetical protein